MRWMLRWRSRIGLCAIVAIAAHAFAPALAAAKAALHDKTVAYAQICTSQGLITVALDASSSDGSQPTSHAEDCPFCRIDTGDVPLPQTSLAFAPPLALAFAPPLFFTTRDPLHSWAAHHSRGPPAHS